MQVEIKIDASCTEAKVTIQTASMTEEVCRILNRLSEHAPEILSGIRNERTEVIEQEELIRVYANAGKVFAMASVIWDVDRWSIAKQTGVYFIITASVMMPVAYIAGWMERSILGAVIYFLVFVFFFGAAWLVQYAVMRYKVGKMNRTLLKKKEVS